jgi:hypothetical protein
MTEEQALLGVAFNALRFIGDAFLEHSWVEVAVAASGRMKILS